DHTLTFRLYYANRGSGFVTPSTLDYVGTPNQQYRVDVMNPAAPVTSMAPSDILANVFKTQIGDPLTKSPTLYTFDLSPFAGQTVRLRFAEVDNQFYFQASVDKLAVATTGRLEVKKSLSPSNDPGLFDLKIDGTTEASNVGNGGTTGEKQVSAGTHTVSEGGGTGTNAGDYTASVVCRDGNGSGSVVAAGSGSVPLNVPVNQGADIVCTITNTRNTGTIEVKKTLSPTSDPGKFNLQIDGTTKATDAGNGGTTGAITVNAGTNHSVAELAGTGTTLGDYTSALACTRNGSGAESGSGTSLSSITVNKNDVPVCTITNTKHSKIVVRKDAVPNDPQDFSFSAGGGLSPTSFQLDDDGDNSNGLSNTQVFDDLMPRSGYSVSETTPAG